jgi:glycosyltransferase involved in cell wall biosynthesis
MGLWWMSEKQREKYMTLFPFLSEKDNIVLSSVFDPSTLGKIEFLRNSAPKDRRGWMVLGSSSWVKGAEAAEKWCKDNQKDYEVVWNLPYDKLLAKLSVAEGFVYLPVGGDTCPRMVIEAKLLGCQLVLNDNVQHKSEEWFDTDDLDSIKTYLFSSRQIFWSGVRRMMEYRPKISGYTTTYNCVRQEYPFIESIMSMVGFCDEICVVDGGSTDGTWEELQRLAGEHNQIKLKQVTRDWDSPRHAVFDGMQKAEARAMCTEEYCWQMDVDEVVHEDDAPKIVEYCRLMPKEVNMIALPVIEYWGGPEKVRIDIQPWKWRLSRNLKDFTHGIPKDLRRYDEDGALYAAEGTDGCDMIHVSTGERCQFITFHNQETEELRRKALTGEQEFVKQYESWFSEAANSLPGVHHYSWYDIPRKMRLYRDYWTKHWNSLYNKPLNDTAETNMMFDLPWSQVTDEMIEKRAAELEEGTGGWIWHRKWQGQRLPHIVVNKTEPKLMRKLP